jgi:hypothetical protein
MFCFTKFSLFSCCSLPYLLSSVTGVTFWRRLGSVVVDSAEQPSLVIVRLFEPGAWQPRARLLAAPVAVSSSSSDTSARPPLLQPGQGHFHPARTVLPVSKSRPPVRRRFRRSRFIAGARSVFLSDSMPGADVIESFSVSSAEPLFDA